MVAACAAAHRLLRHACFRAARARQLIAQPDFRIEAVVTQPDRPRGRGGEIAVSPVKNAAIEAGIAVYQPEKIKSDAAYDYFQRIAPDVAVIIAYGQIIPARASDIPGSAGSIFTLPCFRNIAALRRLTGRS